MSRFINWILTAIAVCAGAALVVDGIHPAGLFNDDATILLCIAVAVPSAVVAIRMHTERITAALADTFEQYAQRMEEGMDRHADRICKRTTEQVLETVLRAETGAAMDRAERRAGVARWADTGPIRIPQVPQ